MTAQYYDFCIGTVNPAIKKKVISTLVQVGFNCTGEGKNAPSFLRTLRMVQPWLAVIDTELPPGNITELVDIIENDSLAAVVLINSSNEVIANRIQVSWPFEDCVLVAVSETVCLEFGQKKKLLNKIEELQKQFANRKIIDRAKGIVMQRYSASEEEAYRLIQTKSMENRVSLVKMADQIIKGLITF